MSKSFVCSQGHRWDAHSPLDGVACPHCGEPAQTLAGSAAAPDGSATPPTIPLAELPTTPPFAESPAAFAGST